MYKEKYLLYNYNSQDTLKDIDKLTDKKLPLDNFLIDEGPHLGNTPSIKTINDIEFTLYLGLGYEKAINVIPDNLYKNIKSLTLTTNIISSADDLRMPVLYKFLDRLFFSEEKSYRAIILDGSHKIIYTDVINKLMTKTPKELGISILGISYEILVHGINNIKGFYEWVREIPVLSITFYNKPEKFLEKELNNKIIFCFDKYEYIKPTDMVQQDYITLMKNIRPKVCITNNHLIKYLSETIQKKYPIIQYKDYIEMEKLPYKPFIINTPHFVSESKDGLFLLRVNHSKNLPNYSKLIAYDGNMFLTYDHLENIPYLLIASGYSLF